MKAATVPNEKPVDPDPANPPTPGEGPVVDADDRSLADRPEQYPDDEDMPLPND